MLTLALAAMVWALTSSAQETDGTPRFIPSVIGEKRTDDLSQMREHKVIRADGEIRWQDWTNRAIVDETGHVAAYQAFGRDVTDGTEAGC